MSKPTLQDLNQLIALVDKFYPDNVVRDYWQFDKCQMKPRDAETGPRDGLAEFIASEVSETFQGNESDTASEFSILIKTLEVIDQAESEVRSVKDGLMQSMYRLLARDYLVWVLKESKSISFNSLNSWMLYVAPALFESEAHSVFGVLGSVLPKFDWHHYMARPQTCYSVDPDLIKQAISDFNRYLYPYQEPAPLPPVEVRLPETSNPPA